MGNEQTPTIERVYRNLITGSWSFCKRTRISITDRIWISFSEIRNKLIVALQPIPELCWILCLLRITPCRRCFCFFIFFLDMPFYLFCISNRTWHWIAIVVSLFLSLFVLHSHFGFRFLFLSLTQQFPHNSWLNICVFIIKLLSFFLFGLNIDFEIYRIFFFFRQYWLSYDNMTQ